MWYVLAAANALSGDSELIAGTQLRVPEVGVSKNDASTFKPYNPNEIVGSTAPGLPNIPPASGVSCKQTIGIILAAATRIVSQFVGSIVSKMPVIGFLGPIIGAHGEVQAQLYEKLFDLRQHYDWGAVAAAAVTTLIPTGTTTAAKIALGAARAAASYTISYGVNRMMGKDPSFSLRSFAAATATGAVSGALAAKIPSGVTDGLVSGTVKGIAFDWSRVSMEAVLSSTVQNVAVSALNKGITQAITGERQNWDPAAMLADAFGNALGNTISRAITPVVDSGWQQPNAPKSNVGDYQDQINKLSPVGQKVFSEQIESGVGLEEALAAAVEYSGVQENPSVTEWADNTPVIPNDFTGIHSNSESGNSGDDGNQLFGFEIQDNSSQILEQILSAPLLHQFDSDRLLTKPFGGVYNNFSDANSELRRFLGKAATDDISEFSFNGEFPKEPTMSAKPEYRFLPEGKVEPSTPHGYTRIGTIIMSKSFKQALLENIGLDVLIPDAKDLDIDSPVLAPEKRAVNQYYRTNDDKRFLEGVENRKYSRAIAGQTDRAQKLSRGADRFEMAKDLIARGGLIYQNSKYVMQVDLYRNNETGAPKFEVTGFNFKETATGLSIIPSPVYINNQNYLRIVSPRK